MSWEVVGLVSKRQCGGAVRRVLLLTLAQYAGHNGRDIFASVPTLARDSEIDPRTVQRNLKALIDDGLLELVGQRKCKHGHTNEYRLKLAAIKALPEILRTEDLAEESRDNHRHSATPVSAPPVAESRETPGTAPPRHDVTPGTVSPNPRHSATQSYQGTYQSSSSSSSGASARMELDAWNRDPWMEAIFAAAGPGLVDPAKDHRVWLDLSSRVNRWRSAKWDLELDVLPVIAAKTSKPRTEPMWDFKFLEKDIGLFRAKRLQDAPKPVEIIDAEPASRVVYEHRRAVGGRAGNPGFSELLGAEISGGEALRDARAG